MKSLLLLLAVACLTLGCRRDMYHQPVGKPLRRSGFFENEMASRPLVDHTVAQGDLEADQLFYKGRIGTNLAAVFPMPVTRQVLERGRERFDIYCSPCHGRTGFGNGMIVQRGFPKPPSYHIDRLRQAPPGYFFNVITEGYGVMYSYAQRVKPADRWAIVAYIRALQLSENADVSDVAKTNRALLREAGK